MRPMLPRLIGVDLDGTLLATRRGVSAGHRQAVAALRERGIEVAIVTGRPLLTARQPWTELGLDNALVCFNGVWVGHPEAAAMAAARLETAEVVELLAALAPHPGVINAYPDTDTWLVSHFDHRTRPWPKTYGVTIDEEPRLRADWAAPSFKLMFVADPPVVAALSTQLAARYAGRFHVVSSEPDRFEIHKPHATKAWGLQRLAAHLEIPREAVWAVGDADNDREMVAWAGRGFAMAGATPGLAAVADAVLPSAADDGLLDLLPLLDQLDPVG